MTKTFSQYLAEARIAAPDSLQKEIMRIVASALISINYSREGKITPEIKQLAATLKQKYGNFKPVKLKNGQYFEDVVHFDPKELPERYTKGLKLQKSYPVTLRVGEFGKDDQNHMAYYTQMGRGSSAGITVNLTMLPELDGIGSVEGIEAALDNLEGAVAHEAQHATQDVVLRKRHPDQMALPKEGDSADAYFASDIEFQPQITTAGNDFKRMIKLAKNNGLEVDNAKLGQLFRVFVGASEQMPAGTLKWKKYFNSPFFASLRRQDEKKWKKAVKDIHRLISGN